MKFPDFVIIGCMKCATTVLWHNLNKHPDIHMAKNIEDPKKASTEIRFWNNGQPHRNWEKGIDWYKNLFQGNCAGEKCANYVEHRMTMRSMYRYIPDVKLIMCVRNPVDRAYSEYNMQKERLKLIKFNAEIAHTYGYITRGRYFEQLDHCVLPFFSRENLHIIIQERMKKDTNAELDRLYNFLGVSPYNLDVYETTAVEATDRNLDLIEDGKISKYKKWGSDYEPISDTMKEYLTLYFKNYNDQLFEFLGYEIEEWNETTN